ncbi:prophage endopeptidase tail family protein, partial [Rummeliibacillus suwonensis]|uniref:prophage endopeptidase tail family protein n=1 Tax=Rummeliibacillus suwonensis TaxID=1306154 RepID=UPI0028A1AF63
MWLEILNVGDYDCLGLENLDATDQEWVEFGETFKPANPAVLTISAQVSSIVVKVKDPYKNTDYMKGVSLYDENGNEIFYYDYSYFDENGQIIIDDQFPPNQVASIEVQVFKPNGMDYPEEIEFYWVDVIVVTTGDDVKHINSSIFSTSYLNTKIIKYVHDDRILILSSSIKARSSVSVIIKTSSYKNLSMNISANSALSARANVSWNVQNGHVIYIVDPNTFVRYLPISNVMNPLISEQINAQYTFSFETLFDGNAKYMNNENMIEIENDYFKVNRIVKERGSSVSMSVNCEHVSYQLIKKKDYPLPFEEIEDDPQTIMTTLLEGTPFTLGTVEVGGSYYIKPNSDNIRGALIELANLVGGELVFHQFTISLVSKRGQDNGLEFKLGENLIGVTEEIDTTEDEPRHALEVDVLDLAQIPEYAYLATVGLGDIVRTFDPILEIDETLRIISRDYNPFQKINPRVQIGNVIRDITEYMKETKEEEEEPTEESEVSKYLSEFKIGDVDLLPKASEETTAVVNYLKGSAAEVLPSATFEAEESQYTGLFAKLKQEYENAHFTIMLSAEQNGDKIIDSRPWSELESAMATFPVMPPETTYMAFTFIISDVPFADLQANPSLLETTFLKAFGITVRLPGTEPVNRKGTLFGTIMDIRGNDDYTVDVRMRFENEDETDNTWYPFLSPTGYYNLQDLMLERAMMVDGVVLGIFKFIMHV